MYDLMIRFAAAVDEGGVSAAARMLHISQPAVTKSLKQLEEHYGVPLLVRGKQGVVPTEYGEVVYRLAKLMAKSIEDVDVEISTRRKNQNARLNIGVGLLWRYVYLPNALDNLTKRMPELNIDITLYPPLRLHDMICKGELDIGIGQMPRERFPGIVYEELLVSKSALFAHHSHPLRSKKTISDKNLQEHPWIVFAVSDKEAITTIMGVKETYVTKVDSLLMACLLMQEGNHLMRLPRSLAPVLAKFDIEPLKHKAMESEFTSGLYYRESALMRTASREMIKEIRTIK